jgi:hypothetical protein
VTCTTKRPSKGSTKVTVTCKVTHPKTTAKAKRASWRLTRNGHTYDHGTVATGSARAFLVHLHHPRALAHGTYRLRITLAGAKRPTVIASTLRIA